MKVFKYLVALADISVGFLGLFFLIFAITRPSLSGAVMEKRQLEKKLAEMRAEIRQLEELKLAGTSTGKPFADDGAGKVMLSTSGVQIEIGGQRWHYRNAAGLAAAAPQLPWPSAVILYVDHRLAFERVVAVIEALKTVKRDLTVQIAALAKD